MKQKWVKCIARAILPCFVFFVFSFAFAPEAHAVEFNGKITYGWNGYDFGSKVYTYKVSVNGDLPVVSGLAPASGQSQLIWNWNASNPSISYGDFRCNTYPEQVFKSEVKLYASYYGVRVSGGTPTRGDNFLDTSTWQVSYINDYGQTGYVERGLDKIETFTAPTSSAWDGVGVAIEASWSADEGHPIRALSVKRDDGKGWRNQGSDSATNGVIHYPSIRIITSETTAEMVQLDKVANAIIEQNDILLAMKGDLVAILQDIYQMTGDMYIAQDLLNQYVSQMLPLLENIDQTTTNIYILLGSQLRALEVAVNNAATTIEAAIAAQTAAMIAYLESVLNTGNEVPDDTYQQQQDASNILDQMESLEKPNVDTIVPEIGDYTDSGVSGVLSAIFSSNLIVTMMTLSFSFAFGAYVLFGKRE